MILSADDLLQTLQRGTSLLNYDSGQACARLSEKIGYQAFEAIEVLLPTEFPT